MARYQYVSEHIAHLLDPQLQGYPIEYHDPATGESFAVAPFQYFESQDHRRFINTFGESETRELIGEAYGNRNLCYTVQPYIIALYTAASCTSTRRNDRRRSAASSGARAREHA